jgi:cell fate regulator YaaT (PSP1 superfamily)
MTREASNALLKTLEEPSAGTHIFLLTQHRNQILPTLVSRCQPLRFDPVPAAQVRRLLEARGADPAAAEVMAVIADGCPGAVAGGGASESRTGLPSPLGGLLRRTNWRCGSRVSSGAYGGVQERRLPVARSRVPRWTPSGRDPGAVDCELGDWVVVQTERGMALGQVATAVREPTQPPAQPLKQVLRRADDRDILRYEQNCELEGYAYQFCLERVRDKGLPMKMVDVEYLFDGSKAIFYFTAESRVDFRELVRDLARQFHTRIEMRQIGVRDEAKLVGGVGCCGRPLCCATWLTQFAPISVRMAKDQHVSLNPTKISGICGRLMCCLSYEHAMYKELAREMPKVGKRVETPDGSGKVVRRNVLEGTFVVAAEGREFEIRLSEYDEGAVAPGSGDGGQGESRQARGADSERPRQSAEVSPAASTAEAPPESEGERPPTAPNGRPPVQRKRRRRRKKKASHSPERKSDG